MGRGPPSFVNHPLSARTVKWSQRPIRGSMQTPRPFDLDLTVRSHGFYDLPPWSYDRERRILSRALRDPPGRVVVAQVAPGSTPGDLALRVAAGGKLSAREAADVRATMRTCLAL